MRSGGRWGYVCGVTRVAKQLLAQFEEDTAYERFVLDTVATAGHPPNPTPPPRDDLRGGGLSMGAVDVRLARRGLGGPGHRQFPAPRVWCRLQGPRQSRRA